MDRVASREELERSLGFALSEFRRLPGGSSPNFKAVRASDGLPFLAKFLPGFRSRAYRAVVSHADELAGEKIAHRLFAYAPEKVGDISFACFEWCEGRHVLPDELSEDGLKAFLREYLGFSEALQKVSVFEPEDPFMKWRSRILAIERRCVAPIRRFVEREIPESAVARRPGLSKKVYGDFHHGNVLFRDGKVYRYLDLESIGIGYPADDIVRYFACAMEHLPFGGFYRKRRMLDAFARAVKFLPYSLHEWEAAINAAILRKFDGRSADEFNVFVVANLLYRAKFYLNLKSVARSVLQ